MAERLGHITGISRTRIADNIQCRHCVAPMLSKAKKSKEQQNQTVTAKRCLPAAHVSAPFSAPDEQLPPLHGSAFPKASRSCAAFSSRERYLRAASSFSAPSALDRHCCREPVRVPRITSLAESAVHIIESRTCEAALHTPLTTGIWRVRVKIWLF